MKKCFYLLFLLWIPAISQVAPVYSDPLNAIKTSDNVEAEAIQMIRFGDAEGAILKLKKKYGNRERSFECEFLIGYSYKLLGDLKNSIEYFSKATRINPSSIPAFFERGNCYLLRKNFAQAVFDFNHVIEIDSLFLPAYNNRAFARICNFGEVVQPTYQLKMAIDDMQKVIRLSESYPPAQRAEYYFNLGLLNLYISEYSKAQADFTEAIYLQAKLAKAYYYRAASYFLAHYYNEAKADFKTAESLGFYKDDIPNYYKVLDLVAQHEESTGNYIGK